MPSLFIFVLSLVVGVGAGYLGNLAADRLPARWPAVQAVSAAPGRKAWRSGVVVVALAVLFPLLALQHGGAPAALFVNWCYAWFLTTVLVIDLETRRVLNVMIGPAAIFAVLASLWLRSPSLPSMLAGGLVALLLFWSLYVVGRLLFGRGALGFGDVKLAGVIGLMTGYPGVLQALVFGAVLGGIAALILLATRHAGLKTTNCLCPLSGHRRHARLMGRHRWFIGARGGVAHAVSHATGPCAWPHPCPAAPVPATHGDVALWRHWRVT